MTAGLEAWRTPPDDRSSFPGNVPGTEKDDRSPFLPPYVGNGERSEDDDERPAAVDRPGLFLDVGKLLEGGLPDGPAPISCRRSDGHALFYRAQVNLVFGDAEGGKTWLGLAAATEALSQGRRVLVLDMDHNGPESTIDRLLALGASKDALIDRALFRYVEPEDTGHLVAIVAACKVWRPAVAVVDSVGELLPLLRLSSNSPDDFTIAHARVLKPLAMAGAVVIAVDHLAKNTDSRTAGPTGTAAKRRAVGGVSLRVTVKDAFTPGHGGAATLTVNKDRHGGLRRHCPTGDREPYAGTFVLTDEGDDALSWRIAAPRDGEHPPIAAVLASDVAALEALDPEPASVSDVKARMSWGSTRASDALKAWREHRSSVPHTYPGERGTVCSTCLEPLDPVLADVGVHPACEVPA